jgi:hypothetical protein
MAWNQSHGQRDAAVIGRRAGDPPKQVFHGKFADLAEGLPNRCKTAKQCLRHGHIVESREGKILWNAETLRLRRLAKPAGPAVRTGKSRGGR